MGPLNAFSGVWGAKKLPSQVRIIGGSSSVSVGNWPSTVDVNVQNGIEDVTNWPDTIDVDTKNWLSN